MGAQISVCGRRAGSARRLARDLIAGNIIGLVIMATVFEGGLRRQPCAHRTPDGRSAYVDVVPGVLADSLGIAGNIGLVIMATVFEG